jgi:hypothetical protein
MDDRGLAALAAKLRKIFWSEPDDDQIGFAA